VVRAGPSFGTQREFARAEIVEIIRAFPDSAPILGPMFLENSDWPGADEAAEQLKAMTAPQQQDPQQSQQMQAMMQQAQEQMAQLAQENEALKQQAAIKAQELQIRAFEAETKRLEVQAKAQNDALGHQVDAASAAMQARQSNPFTMEGTL
jgi:septal ring factor EnvC (AmiA/AmiB activator)